MRRWSFSMVTTFQPCEAWLLRKSLNLTGLILALPKTKLDSRFS